MELKNIKPMGAFKYIWFKPFTFKHQQYLYWEYRLKLISVFAESFTKLAFEGLNIINK